MKIMESLSSFLISTGLNFLYRYNFKQILSTIAFTMVMGFFSTVNAQTDTYYERYSTQTTPHFYEGNFLTGVDFPIGALGGGTIRMNGKAERAWWQIFNNFEERAGSGIVPNSFFAIRTNTNGATVVKALQTSSVGQFSAMNSLKFTGEFPFGWYNFNDNTLPVEVRMEAFNPLIPMDLKNSAIPCAIFKITVKNTSTNASNISILGTQQNAVGFGGYGTITNSRVFSGYGSNVNTIVSDASSTSMKMTGTNGSMQLTAYETGMSSTASWDTLSTLYTDFSADGALTGATTASSPATSTTVDGALAKSFTLAPGEEKTITFVLSWYFPNGTFGRTDIPMWNFPNGGCMYENWWTNADDVDAYVKTNYTDLETKTRLYHKTLYASNIPRYAIDRVNSNLCVLKSPTAFWLKNGYFGVWESTSDKQEWFGNCKHVYQYAQSISWIFPELSRKIMDQNMNTQTTEGLLPSRDGEMLNALDGHLGTILGIYRDHLLTDDNVWLSTVWVKTKKAMDYVINKFDPDMNGTFEGVYANTLDGSTSGTNPVIGGMYVAALNATAKMAERMNDSASRDLYNSIAITAKTNISTLLWDDSLKYFVEKSQNLPNSSSFGNGSYIGMFDGQWWSNMLDLGQIYPLDKTIVSLSQIYNRNKVTDIDGQYSTGYRDFLGNGDTGWIMSKFTGNLPAHPVHYHSEVMSGFEYPFAASMIQNGMTNEGLDVVNNIAKRYDGRLRGSSETTTASNATVYGAGSPFGEDECGDFYGRAMSSWSVLIALQGFNYDGPNKIVKFIPKWKADNHVSFYSSSTGYGILSQTQTGTNQVSKIEVKSGSTKIKTIVLSVPNNNVATSVVAKLNGAVLPVSSIEQSGNTLTLVLTSVSDVNANSNLTVTFDLAAATQTTLVSDFNDGTIAGWTQVSGTWSNVNNSIQGASPGNGLLTKNDYIGTDFSYEADIKLTTKGAAGVLTFRGNADGSNSYLVALDDASGVIKLYKFPYLTLITTPQTFTPDSWYHLKVVAIGQNIKIYFNNQATPCIDFNDATYTSGKFGLNVWASTVLFDNVKITTGVGTTLNNNATLADLKVDGNSICFFSPEKINYSVLVPSTSTTVPFVSAVLSDVENATLSVTQATSIPGTANITVTAQDGVSIKNYIVNIKYDKEPTAQFQPFNDTFDNGGIAGWTISSGTWSNPGTALQGNFTGDGQIIKNDIIGNNFTYEADIKLTTDNGAGILSFRSDGSVNYLVALDKTSSLIKFYKLPYQVLQTVPYTFSKDVWYHLKIVANDKNIKIYFNNNATPVIDSNDATYVSGQFGLFVWNGTAEFDNVTATPLAVNFNTGFQTSYKDLVIPGTIEFEDFDNGGAGTAYADATFGNQGCAYRTDESVDIEAKAGGGYNLEQVNTGEWLEYTVNVNALGKYTASINYAANTTGIEAILYVDDIDKTGTISFASTGDLNTWSDKMLDIQLAAGKHILKFFIKNAASDLKLDKIIFTEKDVVYPGNGTGLNKTLWRASAPGTWFQENICGEIDPIIDEVWADVSPGCGIANDFWNARWEGQIEPLYSELYTFYVTVNNMGRVWINNQLVVDGWLSTSSDKTITGTILLTAGQKVPIKVDFAEKTGDAKVKLEWSSASNPKEVVPQYQLFPQTLKNETFENSVLNFKVYPNPAKNKITVDAIQNQVESITIIDLTGRIVYTNSEFFTGIKSFNINLPTGNYLVKLTGSKPYAVQKLIIK